MGGLKVNRSCRQHRGKKYGVRGKIRPWEAKKIKNASEVRPDMKKPRKKSLRLQEPFHLSWIIYNFNLFFFQFLKTWFSSFLFSIYLAMFDSLSKCPLSFCYSITLVFCFLQNSWYGTFHNPIVWNYWGLNLLSSVASDDILVVCFFSYFHLWLWTHAYLILNCGKLWT